MKIVLAWFRRLMALLLVVGVSAPAVTMAQPSTPESNDRPGLVREGEYVSPQFGTEITWTDAWEVGDPDNPLVDHAIGDYWDDSVGSDPTMGDAVFLIDTATGSAVVTMGVGENTGATLDQYLAAMGQDAFLTDNLFLKPGAETLILQDDGSEYVGILARDPAPDQTHAIYVEIKIPEDSNEPITSIGVDLFDPAEYEAALTSLGADISIEGLDVFSAISKADILDALATEAKPTEEADSEGTLVPTATATATDDTGDARDSNGSDDKKLPDAGDDNGSTPEPKATPDSRGNDDEFPGVVADGEYESPQYGDTVSWGDSWVISPDVDAPVQSNEETGLDSILFTDSASERAFVYLTFEPGEFDADTMLETFADPSYQEDVLSLENGEVLLSDSTRHSAAVLLRGELDGDEIIIMLEVRETEDPDVVAYVDVRAYTADFDENLLTGLDEDLEVNGDPGLDVFTVNDILDALDS